MKIATWNVNSLRVRSPLVLDWIKRNQPDVLCLQETKVTDAEFPTDELQRAGYAIAMTGQKSYNGVAIAARKLMRNIRIGFHDAKPGEDARLISATIGKVQVYCCYVPNGKRMEDPAYEYKLAWLKRLRQTLGEWSNPEKHVVVCGDFNVATDSRDVYDPELFRDQIHFSPKEHAALLRVKEFGLDDLYRTRHTEGGAFSWWDYRGGAFRKNQGMRIDYLFTSKSLTERTTRVWMDTEERGKEQPSDHIPVVAEFEV